jgi:hypothetical protein
LRIRRDWSRYAYLITPKSLPLAGWARAKAFREGVINGAESGLAYQDQ